MSSLDINLIFEEILIRLPAKSLIRFKCVSKIFQATISSRDFAELCLRQKSLSTEANDILIRPGGRSIICYDLNSDPFSTAISAFNWDCSSVSVVGSSNGLLCIFVVDVDIDCLFVANPTTQIYKCVYFPRNRDRGHIGFAFDYKNLDYKIVAFFDSNYESTGKIRSTFVYSLNTNSWTIEDEVGFPLDSMKGRRDGALINSHLLHWIFCNPAMEARIGCFDVCTMKWADDVLLPSYFYDPTQDNDLIDFGVFNDHLFSSFENRIESCFDVWVMKKYGDPDSWFILLSIPFSVNLASGFVPVAYRGGSDGEILIRKRLSYKLFWYNCRNGEMSEANFDGAQDFSRIQAYICSTSLVDIPGGKLVGN